MAVNLPSKTFLNTPPSVPQTNLQNLQQIPTQAAPQGLPKGMSEVWNLYFQGKHQEVLQASEQALFRTGNVDYIHLAGLSMIASGRKKDGLDWLRASLTLFPSPAWFSNAAIIALEANEIEASMEFAKKGLERFPDDSKLNFNLGNVLLKLQRYGEATEYYVNALNAEPEMMGAVLNLGNCFNRLGFRELAEQYYRKVLASDVNNELASINISILLTEQARYEEAEKILTNPKISHNKELQFLLSMLRLGQGDYKVGWPMYKQRWNSIMAGELGIKRIDRLPHSLEDLKGKHILIHHEQGFGDSLQFVRYAPLFLKHAQKVSLLTPKPLHRLFSLINPALNLVDAGQPYDKNAYDYECGLMDAPELFNTTIETIPNAMPYFTVPQELVNQYKLPKTENLRVGICFAGQLRSNPDLKSIDRRRSMKITDFDSFNDITGVDFYSLQFGDLANTVQTTEFGKKLRVCLSPQFDFLDTAAIMKQLDLVIAVDTSSAHLSAGLGVPTLLLSRFDQCWRWSHVQGITTSPWYPNSLKIYRQSVIGSWKEPLAAIKSDLLRVTKYPKTAKKLVEFKEEEFTEIKKLYS